MIEFELSQNLASTRNSGSDTLAHLQWALEFTMDFLDRLDSIQDSDNCSGIAIQAYNATLARHHNIVIRTTAKTAMRLLPTKMGLIMKVHPEATREGTEQVREAFPRAARALREVYSSVLSFYQEADLNELL